ncbi:uncharacterized protein LOC142981884 [Anticarsia gemmatalis]|uniref:uncharacterized protein LOC142981884 n=1 Tax=Anticarsia gemmatalis TaxID=129554 RepID=UPI003F777F22
MAMLASVRVLTLTLFVVLGFDEAPDPLALREYEKICNKVPLDPYFKTEAVLGTKWRVYYTWNLDVKETGCIDIKFKRTNALMIKNVKERMQKFLQVEPDWSNAPLMLIMSKHRHILLVSDPERGPSRFIQVPFFSPDDNYFMSDLGPQSRVIPLVKITVKLFYFGSYMVMSDCSNGITYLLARRDKDLMPSVVKSIVDFYDDFGPSYLACDIKKHKIQKKLRKTNVTRTVKNKIKKLH